MKLYILLPVSILGLVFSASIVSASNASFTVNLQGEALSLVATSIRTNSGVNMMYRDGKDDDSDNDTNATGTAKKNGDDNASSSSKYEGENDDENDDENENFEMDGMMERFNNPNRGFLISEMAQVHSGNDLHTFVQSIVHKNSDITKVVTKDDRVSMTRNMPAKLFGFIPMSTNETAEVISWGDGTKQVSVNRPWWNIFLRNGTSTEIISSGIEFRIKDIPASEFKLIMDASTKARIIAGIEAVFIANGFATSAIKD